MSPNAVYCYSLRESHNSKNIIEAYKWYAKYLYLLRRLRVLYMEAGTSSDACFWDKKTCNESNDIGKNRCVGNFIYVQQVLNFG